MLVQYLLIYLILLIILGFVVTAYVVFA